MGQSDQITNWDLLTTVDAIATKQVSSVEVVDAYLEAIEQKNPQLNAVVVTTAEEARQQAKKADETLSQGSVQGPLHGIPMVIKDMFDTAGVETTGGSRVLAGRVPERNATAVQTLLDAGAIMCGKAATHEFAMGGTTNNEHYGPTRNPHNLERIPGGSSGGSGAAVSGGLSLFSIGTDTAGSVRAPAAACGCVGFKPTYGTVSQTGLIPLAPSLDHVGPLTKTVGDAVYVAEVLRSGSPSIQRVRDLVDQPIQNRKVGRLRGFFEDLLQPEVRRGVDDAAAALTNAGAIVEDIDLGDLNNVPLQIITIMISEAKKYHDPYFQSNPELYGEVIRGYFTESNVDPAELNNAKTQLRTIADRITSALRDVDVLMSATVATPAVEIGAEFVNFNGVELPVEAALTRLTSVFNYYGGPAIAVPSGESEIGLPTSVQFIGRFGEDNQVIPFAAEVERSQVI